MRFSLIVATVGRSVELRRLFESLTTQTFQDFQIIVVDQNTDERVSEILSEFPGLPVRHVRADKSGHARANNAGLRFAEGEIVHFPDDDCWYPSDLFDRVNEFFTTHPQWAAVTGRESSGKWDANAGKIDRFNVWRRHISFTMFFRREAIDGLLFDETLGVGAGTQWGSGEESDYLLRVMRRAPVYYDPSLVVWHPEWTASPCTPAKCAKARSYGMGMGHVLRMHAYPGYFAAYHLARPAAGTVLALFRGNLDKARLHWSIFLGRTAGWLATGPDDIKRGRQSAAELGT